MKAATPFVVVAVLALVVRLGHLLEVQADPPLAVADEAAYLEDARFLAEVSWSGRPAAGSRSVLYAYPLAFLSSFTSSRWAPHLLQSAAGLVACLLVWSLGCRLLPAGAALAAALAACLYGPLIYFEGRLVPVTFAVLLHLVLIWALQRTPSEPPGRALLPGLVAGLAAATSAASLLFLPVVVWWLWRYPASPATTGWRPRAFWFVVGCLIVLAPLRAWELRVGGEGGEGGEGGATEMAAAVVSAEPGDPTGGGFDGDRATDPAAWLGELYSFWRGEELPRHLDPYWSRSTSSLLATLLWQRGLAFPFGLIAPLALAGLLVWLREPSRPEGATLVVGAVLVFAAAAPLFGATSPYRLTVAPLLLLLAARGAWSLARVPRRALVLGGMVVLAVAVNVGSAPGAAARTSAAHFWRGRAYARDEMPANAARAFRTALRVDADMHRARLALALLQAQRDELSDAVELYRSYLEARPEDALQRRHLATVLLRAGRPLEAVTELERLAEASAGRADLYGHLAYANLAAGQPAAAARAYRRVLALRPDSTLVRYQLARLHENEDRADSAETQYRRLLGAHPDHLQGRLRLANLLVDTASREHGAVVPLPATPGTKEAEGLLRGALEIGPDGAVDVYWGLGRLLARQGRYSEAVDHMQAVVERAPGDAVAHLFLGRLYLRLEEPTRAETHLAVHAQLEREQRLVATARAQAQEIVRQILGDQAPELE